MKLSIVMPAYNAGKYIEAAIRSVMEQESFPEDSEIIVIDDGSSDETDEIARSNGAVVLTQDHKGAEGAIKTFFAQFDLDPVLQAVFSYAREFFSDELTEEEKSGLKLKSEPYGGTLPGCSLLKRSVFDTIGLFDETLHGGETVDWMVRFRSAGIKSAQTDTVTLKRRVHANNTGSL